MIKRIAASLVLAVMLVVVSGCSAHMHKIGKGAAGSQVTEQRQWYILWGLVPLNTVDTSTMAAGAFDYDIKTEASALDVVMNIFTGAVTVYSRTVTVTK
jgi:hypothetical protein